MTRKAFFFGVGNYGQYAPRLTAPVEELQRWQRLLTGRPYRFGPIRVLADAQATRANVLEGLEWLLDGAQSTDQLIFGFIGHGTVAPGRNPNDAEQSLITYPGTGGLAAAAVTETDVETIFLRKRPPLGTNITAIIDCCFAANYGDPALFRANRALDGAAAKDSQTDAIPLFVPTIASGRGPVANVLGTGRQLVRFGAFADRAQQA
ncbi:MAG TPA: caspase family protein, partial [Thermoanaerobaculia bacterium]|nr:caspase family protein [Thermoanaerobaculia bacterium]